MITTERLKELIKQKGVVYKISYGEVWEMPLINDEKNHCDISCDKFLHFHELLEFNDSLDNRWTDYYVGLNELFESKEQAEWVCKMTAERTERFEPPMWEDIDNFYDFRFIVNNKCLRLYVRKDVDCILIFTEDDDRIFNEPATKENYIKACEIVRDLFIKGGAKC